MTEMQERDDSPQLCWG